MKTRCGARRCFTWVYLASTIVCLISALPALAAQLTLTWTDNASNESGFRVERRLNPAGSYSEIAIPGPNITSYIDTTVVVGQGYCYRVRAHNAAGNSDYTNEACGTVPAVPSVVLTVVKQGTGSVTSAPPSTAINCGADCSETVPSGTPVTLAAAPGAGFTFTGWSGGCSGSATTCTVTLTANTTVTATFASVTYTLTVSKAGSGTGTVAGPGISCGTDCSHSVAGGTAVTLTATADNGSTFTGWSGACNGTGSCSVTVSANTVVSATFGAGGGGSTTYAQRLVAGGGGYTDAGGNFWSADRAYSPGSWGYVGGNSYRTTDPIGNTQDDPLYQAERYGNFSYQFDVPDGRYDVTLHFAEIFFSAPAGQRRFDVSIEGALVLDNYDVYAVAGHDVAVAVTFPDILVTDGQLTIDFTTITGNAKVSAIDIQAAVSP